MPVIGKTYDPRGLVYLLVEVGEGLVDRLQPRSSRRRKARRGLRYMVSTCISRPGSNNRPGSLWPWSPLALFTRVMARSRSCGGELFPLKKLAHGPVPSFPSKLGLSRSFSASTPGTTHSHPASSPPNTSRKAPPSPIDSLHNRHGRQDPRAHCAARRAHPAHHPPHERSSAQREGTAYAPAVVTTFLRCKSGVARALCTGR